MRGIPILNFKLWYILHNGPPKTLHTYPQSKTMPPALYTCPTIFYWSRITTNECYISFRRTILFFIYIHLKSDKIIFWWLFLCYCCLSFIALMFPKMKIRKTVWGYLTKTYRERARGVWVKQARSPEYGMVPLIGMCVLFNFSTTPTQFCPRKIPRGFPTQFWITHFEKKKNLQLYHNDKVPSWDHRT